MKSNTKVWVILIIGMITGIIFWGGFNTAMEATNSTAFCISCHEMRDNVYQEYKETIHYKNASGVQAGCADCHVPRPWGYKVFRKFQASGEIWHKLRGTINTREKFIARRPYLANRVQEQMKATKSRECRNCHDFENMDFEEQDKYARKRHTKAVDEETTCIECHDGIAHHLPEEDE